MKKLLLLSGLLAGLTLLLVVLLLSDLGRRQAEGEPAGVGRAVVDTADPAGHAHRPAAGARGRRPLEQVVQAAREIEERLPPSESEFWTPRGKRAPSGRRRCPESAGDDLSRANSGHPGPAGPSKVSRIGRR